LFLPDSKRQHTIVLNAPAPTVLNGIERIGSYVPPGANPERPRPDLKRQVLNDRAGRTAGVRLRLRHTRYDPHHHRAVTLPERGQNGSLQILESRVVLSEVPHRAHVNSEKKRAEYRFENNSLLAHPKIRTLTLNSV
jgi:hypothetical protein